MWPHMFTVIRRSYFCCVDRFTGGIEHFACHTDYWLQWCTSVNIHISGFSWVICLWRASLNVRFLRIRHEEENVTDAFVQPPTSHRFTWRQQKNQLQCQQGQLQRQQTLISFVIVLLAEESINFSIALDYNGNHVVLHFNGSYSLTHN